MATLTFGGRLKAARKRCGLTLAELARRAKTGKSPVSRYEHDLLDPKLSTVIRLADALGVTVDELLPTRKPRRTHRRAA